MPVSLEDLRIGFPKIAVARTATIARGNAFEQATARLFTTITQDKGDHLTRSSTERHPQPALVRFRGDETVEFVQFKNIPRLPRPKRVSQPGPALSKPLQQKQHRLQRHAEDAGDATQADAFKQGFFHKAVKLAIAFGNQHTGCSTIVAEAALLAVGGMPVFDDIGALAGRAPVYDAGGNHGSEEAR